MTLFPYTTLFRSLNCDLAQQIWFWLGKSQDVMHEWHTFGDILLFACKLNISDRICFLIVLCAVCWTLWKYRNDSCFNNCAARTARTLILQIKSLLSYWSGNVKARIQQGVEEWMPVVEDAIPLAQYMPLEIVPYQPPEPSPLP